MSQYDFGTIDPDTKNGTDLAVDLNNWRDGVHSLHRGASRPAYLPAGGLWIQDVSSTSWILRLWDGTNDNYLAALDPSIGDIWVGNDVVRTTSIKDGAVTAPKIAANAVETAKINASAVTDAKLASNAVTSAKIADGNVTFAKLAGAAVATGTETKTGTASNKLVTPDGLSVAQAPFTLTQAATVAWNARDGINFSLQLSANRTIGNVTNRADVLGRTGIFLVWQSGGPYTLSWASQFHFADGEAPELEAGINIFAYYHETSTKTFVAHAGGGFAP
ncbi:MAG: hypothetical protein AAF414_17210 [Pseudomonadota bacterium]